MDFDGIQPPLTGVFSVVPCEVDLVAENLPAYVALVTLPPHVMAPHVAVQVGLGRVRLVAMRASVPL